MNEFDKNIRDELLIYCKGCVRETVCKKKTYMIFECNPNNCVNHIIEKLRTAEQTITSLSKINEQLETQIKSERKKRSDAEAKLKDVEGKINKKIKYLNGIYDYEKNEICDEYSALLTSEERQILIEIKKEAGLAEFFDDLKKTTTKKLKQLIADNK